jgi:hypothetical protein
MLSLPASCDPSPSIRGYRIQILMKQKPFYNPCKLL